MAVFAVANSFYAVPACLDLGAAHGNFGDGVGQVAVDGDPPPSSPNVSATKLLAFAQSSQVHPVIAMEVASSTDRAVSESADAMGRWLRPVAGLVVLASGRECAAVEIVSTPDARAAPGKGVSGGGIVPTSVGCSAPRHGITTLPSPILAAAPLPPRTTGGARGGEDGGVAAGGVARNKEGMGSCVTYGPLVALLTVDGLIHVRSPFCMAVPIASIEVGTRPNDFFTLSALPSPKRSAWGGGGRKVVATSYGGEARLVLCQGESSQVRKRALDCNDTRSIGIPYPYLFSELTRLHVAARTGFCR